MFFSIVVPVYNVEKYIDTCLNSLLGQEFRDFEVVLIDDGSTDSSGDKCDSYAQKDERIRVIHKKNEGLLLARRTGIKASKGEYVLHCDSDDYLELNSLSLLYDVLKEKKYDMLMYGYQVVDNERNVLEDHYNIFPDGSEFKSSDREQIIYKLVSTTWLNNMVTKVCRREVIDIEADYEKNKNIEMGEDLFQVIPLVGNSKTFYYLAQPLYKYRYNPKGMSKNYKISYLYNHIEISTRLYQLCLENKVSDSTLVAFFDKFEHDIFKFYLRFLKSDIDEKKYICLYQEIEKNELVKESLSYKHSMRKSNNILRILTRPQLFYVSKLVSKIFLKKVLL